MQPILARPPNGYSHHLSPVIQGVHQDLHTCTPQQWAKPVRKLPHVLQRGMSHATPKMSSSLHSSPAMLQPTCLPGMCLGMLHKRLFMHPVVAGHMLAGGLLTVGMHFVFAEGPMSRRHNMDYQPLPRDANGAFHRHPATLTPGRSHIGPIHARRRPSSVVHGPSTAHTPDDEMHALLGMLLSQKRAMQAQQQAQAMQFTTSPPPTPGSTMDHSLSSLSLTDITPSELMALMKQDAGDQQPGLLSSPVSCPLVFQTDVAMSNYQPMDQRATADPATHGYILGHPKRTLHSNSFPTIDQSVMSDSTPIITPTSLDGQFILDGSTSALDAGFLSSLSMDDVIALSEQYLASSAATFE